MQRLLLALALILMATDASAQSTDRLRGAPTEATKPTVEDAFGAIVADGSFETGSPNAAWTEFSATFGTPLCDAACGTGGGTGPRTGDWWVWFGGSSAGDVGSVEQDVTIPSAASATLRFYLEIPVVATSAGTNFVRALMDGTEVFLATYGADQPTYGTYALVEVDVAAFADGGTHTLRFESTTTTGGNFFIDDVSIEAAISGPSIQISPSAVNFGSVQANEGSATETVTLTNNGGAALTIASIAYTGNSQITLDDAGTDLTLDPGQSTTFDLTFAPTSVGEAAGTVTITSDAPSSPNVIAVTGMGSNVATFPSTDTPMPVPDGAVGGDVCGDPGMPAVSTISVAGVSGTVVDLDLLIDISATWIGDVEATLSHGGTSVIVIDNPGAATPAACGNSTDHYPGIILNDAAANSVQTGPFPLVAGASYSPAFPLSAFNGDVINGDWVLSVTDGGEGDPTELNGWSLLVTPSGGVAGEEGASALSRLTVSPNPVASQGQLSLTVASAQDVRVALYDALGREVRVLLDRTMTAGQQAHIGFTTRDLPAGVYVVRATGADLSLTQQVTVVR